jgi:hypothetical protein
MHLLSGSSLMRRPSSPNCEPTMVSVRTMRPSGSHFGLRYVNCNSYGLKPRTPNPVDGNPGACCGLKPFYCQASERSNFSHKGNMGQPSKAMARTQKMWGKVSLPIGVKHGMMISKNVERAYDHGRRVSTATPCRRKRS